MLNFFRILILSFHIHFLLFISLWLFIWHLLLSMLWILNLFGWVILLLNRNRILIYLLMLLILLLSLPRILALVVINQIIFKLVLVRNSFRRCIEVVHIFHWISYPKQKILKWIELHMNGIFMENFLFCQGIKFYNKWAITRKYIVNNFQLSFIIFYQIRYNLIFFLIHKFNWSSFFYCFKRNRLPIFCCYHHFFNFINRSDLSEYSWFQEKGNCNIFF